MLDSTLPEKLEELTMVKRRMLWAKSYLLLAGNDPTRALKIVDLLLDTLSGEYQTHSIPYLLKLKGQNEISAIPGDTDKWANDKNKLDRFNQWMKGLEKDIYLNQAIKVVDDMIGQQNIAKTNQQEKEPAKKPF